MTIRRADDGTIHLEGACPVEDAEPLLQMLLAAPKSLVDWSQCRAPHTAVVQILIAAGAVPAHPCGDGWIAKWL
jgi:hypothetical protein